MNYVRICREANEGLARAGAVIYASNMIKMPLTDRGLSGSIAVSRQLTVGGDSIVNRNQLEKTMRITGHESIYMTLYGAVPTRFGDNRRRLFTQWNRFRRVESLRIARVYRYSPDCPPKYHYLIMKGAPHVYDTPAIRARERHQVPSWSGRA